MSEDTTTKEEVLEEKKVVKAAKAKKAEATEKPETSEKAEKEEKETDILSVGKDALGLEELPEEIKKKMEKKKAEVAKISKKGKKAIKKKKVAKKVTSGKVFINATYNNTIVSITDLQGNVLSWASAGVAGFKGPKKSTPYAAQIISRLAVGKAREEFGLMDVVVYVKGVGTGRESAIRSLNNNGLNITQIKDVTPVPHNGCRQRKPRRV